MRRGISAGGVGGLGDLQRLVQGGAAGLRLPSAWNKKMCGVVEPGLGVIG